MPTIKISTSGGTRIYGLEVELVGVENMLASLKNIPIDKLQKADKIIYAGALAIENDAKHFAPVDGNFLRASIHTEKEKFLEASVKDGVYYGVFQEYGFTHYKSGKFIQNPFLGPAAAINKDNIQNWLRETLKP